MLACNPAPDGDHIKLPHQPQAMRDTLCAVAASCAHCKAGPVLALLAQIKQHPPAQALPPLLLQLPRQQLLPRPPLQQRCLVLLLPLLLLPLLPPCV
jgi:hypothetical protein